MDTARFWDDRAREFAGEREGLRAVCSYAMPQFYNRSIDLVQKSALKGVLDSIAPGTKVLDVGCGVGRWSRALAARGCKVTAVDFSATMLQQAATRTERAGLSSRVRFLHSDVTQLHLESHSVDVVFGVTVLQHVLGEPELHQTLARLAQFLKPGGRMILMEAAPLKRGSACETATFRARPLNTYLDGIKAAGLTLASVHGVDPVPFKLWLVPRFRRWPRALAVAALALATLLSLPLDLVLARPLTRYSWHKVIVAVAPGIAP